MYNESGSVVLPSDITEEDKKFISYHESGHALINVILNNNRRIKEITISNNGSGTLGYVLYENIKKIVLVSKEAKEKAIIGLLGGMAAEELLSQTVFNGASSDMRKAYILAEQLVLTYGSSKDIFPFGYSKIEKLSDNMKEKIEIETQKILRDCYSRAYKILEENKETLILLSNYLIAKCTVAGEEIELLIRKWLNGKIGS